MSLHFSRRDFLKLSSTALAGLPFSPLGFAYPGPGKEPDGRFMQGRVTRRKVQVFAKPDINSEPIVHLDRDRVVPLFEELLSPDGPVENRRWYRLLNGYVHSAYIQRVESAQLNEPFLDIPPAGMLGEVTVPFTHTQYKTPPGSRSPGIWVPLYRLYYGSVHWITGLVESPTGEPCYRLTDEWLRVNYYVTAAHLRPIPANELGLISPKVPFEEKWIEVSLDKQLLTAYEGGRVALQTRVSTGVRYKETPAGEFRIDRKHPSKHMGDGGLTSDINAYELPGVPWACFFHPSGIAFHGAYWHDNFGVEMSNGCVNLRLEDAKWLFCWTSPVFDPLVENRAGWKSEGEGTRVIVI